MFRLHDVGTHTCKLVDQSFNTSVGKINVDPYYRCTKCGVTHKNLSYFSDESCREYLQKQYELDLSSTNPARQRKLSNLSFEEVFEECSDPIDFTVRRSVTVDTHHGKAPEEWTELEPQERTAEPDSVISKITSCLP